MALQPDSSVLSSSRTAVAQIRPARATLRPAPSDLSGRADSAKKTPTPTAGFGKDTVSISSAALQTVNRNLENNRRLIPSVEQLRDYSRAVQAEEEAATEARVAASREVADRTPVVREERPVPEPAEVAEVVREEVVPPPVELSPRLGIVPDNGVSTNQLDVLI